MNLKLGKTTLIGVLAVSLLTAASAAISLNKIQLGKIIGERQIKFESFVLPKNIDMKRGFRIEVDNYHYKLDYPKEERTLKPKDFSKMHVVLISRGKVPESAVGLKVQKVRLIRGVGEKQLVIQCYEPPVKSNLPEDTKFVTDQLAIKIHAPQGINDQFIVVDQNGKLMFR